MISMRTVGYVFAALGVALAVIAWALGGHSWVGLNGHSIESWLLLECLSVALLAFGLVVILTRGRH